MNGIFYGVSVGPGDPELLTVKAVKLLEKVDIIATPRTFDRNNVEKTLALDIASGVVDLSGKEILKLDFLMTRDENLQGKRHEEIAEQMAEKLRRGKDVAMLNLGDASLYATFSYIMELLKNQGFSVEIIPGVPSFCAIAAKLQTSLTTMNQPLHILPAGRLEEVFPLEGTKVVMKTGKSMGKVKSFLLKQEKVYQVQGMERCGLTDEKIIHSVEELEEDLGYFTTLIIK